MALYLGVPFCPTRCAYCSFISADVKGSLALVEPYVDALCGKLATPFRSRPPRFTSTLTLALALPRLRPMRTP